MCVSASCFGLCGTVGGGLDCAAEHGGPIGTLEYIVAFAQRRTTRAKNSVTAILSALRDWPMPRTVATHHGLYTLLRMCVGSQLTHVTRFVSYALTSWNR